jgi:ribonuclease Z
MADIKMRVADQKLPESGADVEATDISEGVVYEQSGVRVTGFEVDHGEALKPSFGYRVDYKGHSVVISGDTRPSANLLRYATGADVIIHEVMAARDEALASSATLRIIMDHHSSPEQAGSIFAEAKPKLAVFTHVILSGDAVSLEELVARTRTKYSGPLEIGEDLMTIDVGHAAVQRRAPREQ